MAKKHGKALGLTILPGMELTFEENPNDYLIYGLTKELLESMPHPYTLGLEKFYKKYNNQLVIVQAHPYRGHAENTIATQFLHGIEGINCNPRHNNFNEKAVHLFHQNPHLLCTCGSDTHEPEDVGQAAVLFTEPMESSFAVGIFAQWYGNYYIDFLVKL